VSLRESVFERDSVGERVSLRDSASLRECVSLRESLIERESLRLSRESILNNADLDCDSSESKKSLLER